MNVYIKNLQYSLFLLVILQLATCTMPRKQVEIWDVSKVRTIAIIPPTTGNFKETSRIDSGVSEQSLYGYVGKIAKDIISESGKFIIVADSKDADAILDCDIISLHHNRYSEQGERGLIYINSYDVIYSIFLKRSSDGAIIGDRAGTGSTSVYEGGGGIIGEGTYKRLINMDRLREVLGIANQRRQEF